MVYLNHSPIFQSSRAPIKYPVPWAYPIGPRYPQDVCGSTGVSSQTPCGFENPQPSSCVQMYCVVASQPRVTSHEACNQFRVKSTDRQPTDDKEQSMPTSINWSISLLGLKRFKNSSCCAQSLYKLMVEDLAQITP